MHCQDGVTELLAASSAKLSSSVVNSRAQIATVREESSDESTVISSQTSTLTRDQGQTVCCLSSNTSIMAAVVWLETYPLSLVCNRY